MARSFSSPSGAPPKMKTGHVLPKVKKGSGQSSSLGASQLDPLRFASSRLHNFKTRREATNNKSGFNTVPSRPKAGRLAHRPGRPNRGSGKEHRALL